MKSYKYRLYPTKAQEEAFAQHLGCVRFIYNWALETKNKAYIKDKTKMSFFDLSAKLPALKKENPWLSEVNAQALQSSLRNLDNAYTNFFRRVKQGAKEVGFPKFKSRKNKQSFQCPQRVSLDFENGKISIPKIFEIKVVFHRKFKGEVKTTTISKTKSGKYFVSVLVEDSKVLPAKPKIDPKTAIGIDLGLKDFAVLSTGEKIANQRFNEKAAKRIAKLNRKMAKQKTMNKGVHTKNREKTRVKLARLYEKVSNQRDDFLHNLSTRLIRENQTICLEDLNVSGMVKNHKLSGSIASASWSAFVRMLIYKCEWYGKNLVFIGRFEPSSKMCSDCGWTKQDLKLSDREWVCQKCGVEHDRDVNAAVNIKTFALHNQNLIKEKIPLHERKSTLGEIEACKARSGIKRNKTKAKVLAKHDEALLRIRDGENDTSKAAILEKTLSSDRVW